jgi:hypothetical protein
MPWSRTRIKERLIGGEIVVAPHEVDGDGSGCARGRPSGHPRSGTREKVPEDPEGVARADAGVDGLEEGVVVTEHGLGGRLSIRPRGSTAARAGSSSVEKMRPPAIA